ncbi:MULTISPECIES: serine/threonine-protein kinase [unclassified Streptomyces]|uniref:serine/threonine-protein kinase n=1 Tax=unclassified Streptomyces TaxID=2593676 RepID=UPI001660F644|nr:MULTISPECIES: serine/threonine-protein kinase [unclassified Streptomyces]MBD0710556.1 serine/threonine protein kinase [Streptomyces sp. CBMA291]MBD0716948.1 serine/threonine protein kinase [Streptomyces sp. CBMA370]
MSAYDGTDRIGNFTVVGTLGHGGMGKVYLCLTPAGQRLAVKVIRKELADLQDIRQRFLREVNALLEVRSPYTVPVYAAETRRPPLWLATRYVAGPTLEKKVVREGPLPERKVIALGRMLAEALSEVHARGVIHRDVKPSNIILEGGEPRLIDFGIARTAAGKKAITIPGAVLGTHGYMAPEQAQGKEPTPAVDVFALGAVLAYAATGRPPFGDDQSASGPALPYEPPRLTGIREPLAALISACLAYLPSARPRPTALLASLGELLVSERGPGSGRKHAEGAPERTVLVAAPPHRCHVPAEGGAGDPCALRPVAARILASGLSPSLVRKAVLRHAR